MFLILIDAHSKWIEAFCVASATSNATIECLRQTFAQFGIPEMIVTDNGTCLVSAEFESFLKTNGVKHLTSAPYHPASNGLAERAVQIMKQGLKKVTQGSLNARLAKILFAYRLTPQSTTGIYFSIRVVTGQTSSIQTRSCETKHSRACESQTIAAENSS